jgi:hypothetical protein
MKNFTNKLIIYFVSVDIYFDKEVLVVKIESSNMQLNSNRIFTSTYNKTERLLFWKGERSQENENKTDMLKKLRDDLKSLIKNLKDTLKSTDMANIEEIGLEEIELDSKEKMELKLLQQMLEKITGKKINFSTIEDMEELKKKISEIKEKAVEIQNKLPKSKEQPKKYGWSLEYDALTERSEYEKMEFSAKGIVKTADGKEISIDVSLLMEREMYEKETFSLRMGDPIDPLIVNFDGNAAELTDTKFEFDLDADGTKDLISFASEGSGFLSLDKNSDGIINNGKELFGPKTGNGFEELLKYDEDGNGWIDENDTVFDELKLWTKTSDGSDVLFSLRNKDIGAIYLGNVDSEFSIKKSIDDTLGVVKNTGIFLKEHGGAGTVQHVDLYV